MAGTTGLEPAASAVTEYPARDSPMGNNGRELRFYTELTRGYASSRCPRTLPSTPATFWLPTGIASHLWRLLWEWVGNNIRCCGRKRRGVGPQT